MSKLEHAISLARKGFYIFPIRAGAKQPPLIRYFPSKASNQVGVIADWWAQWPNANIGISTSKFGDSYALLVVDVDMKGDKDGESELLRHELEGRELPRTYSQRTPTGGRHVVYKVSSPMRQGVDVLGPGLDIRSKGGYILGSGSTVAAGEYVGNEDPIQFAPKWVLEYCKDSGPAGSTSKTPAAPINAKEAGLRVTSYLLRDAPLAVEGAGGDETTYKVAARCKDLGTDEVTTLGLMLDHWNPRCSPPWSPEELQIKVKNAYSYGLRAPGEDTPEVQFSEPFPGNEPTEKADKGVHPLEKINKEYAFVIAGGGSHILWETRDAKDKWQLLHLTQGAFDAKFAPETMIIGNKSRQLSREWMNWKGRRSYDGIVFMPEQEAPPRFYNLWKGFSVKPAERMEKNEAVEAFFEHAKVNVCNNDPSLFKWLVGYFSHIIQRPWEKPLVSLVFRGGKGVGKNALIETVGSLLGGHFLLTSNRRYLISNFNGHLENCLLFVLNEAFWSGDKQAEGVLKDLITGKEHIIEHKGKEPYSVENKTRIVIIGNEEWIVPASYDERRFAVFNVGEGRKQDRKFFTEMREGMERGGLRFLLRYLLDYDISGLDINEAPSTKALMEQKQHSMDPLHQWWLDCLENGTIIGFEFQGWPKEIECERFRVSFRRYIRERQIRSRLPEDRAIGRLLKQCAPGIDKRRLSKREDGQPYAYYIPDLDVAREEWDRFIGYKNDWSE